MAWYSRRAWAWLYRLLPHSVVNLNRQDFRNSWSFTFVYSCLFFVSLGLFILFLDQDVGGLGGASIYVKQLVFICMMFPLTLIWYPALVVLNYSIRIRWVILGSIYFLAIALAPVTTNIVFAFDEDGAGEFEADISRWTAVTTATLAALAVVLLFLTILFPKARIRSYYLNFTRRKQITANQYCNKLLRRFMSLQVYNYEEDGDDDDDDDDDDDGHDDGHDDAAMKDTKGGWKSYVFFWTRWTSKDEDDKDGDAADSNATVNGDDGGSNNARKKKWLIECNQCRARIPHMNDAFAHLTGVHRMGQYHLAMNPLSNYFTFVDRKVDDPAGASLPRNKEFKEPSIIRSILLFIWPLANVHKEFTSPIIYPIHLKIGACFSIAFSAILLYFLIRASFNLRDAALDLADDFDEASDLLGVAVSLSDTLSDSADYVRDFANSAVPCIVIAGVFGTLVGLSVIPFSFAGYKKLALEMRAGRQTTSYKLSKWGHYNQIMLIGNIVSTGLWGLLITFVIVGLFVFCLLFAPLREFIWELRDWWGPMIFAIILYTVIGIAWNYTFQNGEYLRPNTLWFALLLEPVMMLGILPRTLWNAFYRVVYLAGFAAMAMMQVASRHLTRSIVPVLAQPINSPHVLYVVQVSVTFFPQGWEDWDAVYASFLSNLVMHERYNAPIVRAFVTRAWPREGGGGAWSKYKNSKHAWNCLGWASDTIDADEDGVVHHEHQTDDTLDGLASEDDLKDRARSRVVRNKWWLGFMLSKFPTLIRYRNRGGTWTHSPSAYLNVDGEEYLRQDVDDDGDGDNNGEGEVDRSSSEAGAVDVVDEDGGSRQRSGTGSR